MQNLDQSVSKKLFLYEVFNKLNITGILTTLILDIRVNKIQNDSNSFDHDISAPK